jgi:Fuc2NAc and GlcNAc transferase
MLIELIEITMIFLGIAVLSAILVGIVRRLALGWKILDIPNHRSLHDSPTPRGGGLVIVVLCLAGWWSYSLWSGTEPARMVYAYIIAASMIALVSWIDDVRGLSNSVRFAVHAFSAIFVILCSDAAWQSVSIPVYGDLTLGMLGMPLALLWIIGFTNSYNFMDGIDGIAGVQAMVAGIGWLLLGTMNHQPECAVLGLLIAAGSIGFLWWNRPPARIFMGDVGSAFLGFNFAFLSVWAAAKDPHMAVAGVVLVWPFAFDSIFTLLRRLSKGENIFKAHRSHLYQRLIQIGWPHGKVSVLYMGMAALGIIPAVVFVRYPTIGSWLIMLLIPVMAGGLWLLVIYHEKYFSTSNYNSPKQSIP